MKRKFHCRNIHSFNVTCCGLGTAQQLGRNMLWVLEDDVFECLKDKYRCKICYESEKRLNSKSNLREKPNET